MQLATSSVWVSRSPSASASSSADSRSSPGFAAPHLGQLAEVLLERARRVVATRARPRRSTVFSPARAKSHASCLDAGEVVLRDAQDVGDHVERDLVVVVLDEVGLARRFDRVAQLRR